MEERTKEIVETFLEFEEHYKITRKKVRDEFESDESHLHHTYRKTMDGLLVLVIKNLIGKYEKPSEKFEYQLDLTISYVRTHFVINNLILEGDLIEAYTLIRKQLEKLTRLNELDKNSIEKLLNKTPNVINLFGEAGKEFYKELSEVAHGHRRVSEFISFESKNDEKRSGLFPIFKENAIICFDKCAYVDLYFLSWLIGFVKETKSDYDGQKDIDTFLILEKMALDLNIIRTK